MKWILVNSLLIIGLLTTSAHAKDGQENFDTKLIDRDEVKAFINKMVTEHKFERQWMVELIEAMKPRKKIVKAISNPAEKKKWFQYKPIFIRKDRMLGGIGFKKIHAGTLERAEKEYGVPAEIITSIIGVETKYGMNTGKFRVIDSLATLAFNYPKRSKFFLSELEHFLLLTREEGLDPYKIRGSYAGAMGKPQFISSSYRNYAIDFDGDNKRDLWRSNSDIIGSVANYFHRHKWKANEPVAIKAKVSGKGWKQAVTDKLKPQYTVGDLRLLGIKPTYPLDDEMPANLLVLDTKQGKEYWITLHNFYVITRYNHSSMYAMAAFQLSQLINGNTKFSK